MAFLRQIKQLTRKYDTPSLPLQKKVLIWNQSFKTLYSEQNTHMAVLLYTLYAHSAER